MFETYILGQRKICYDELRLFDEQWLTTTIHF